MASKEEVRATLLKTNAGNGYKIAVGEGVWLYAPIDAVEQLVAGERKSVVFGEIKDKE